MELSIFCLLSHKMKSPSLQTTCFRLEESSKLENGEFCVVAKLNFGLESSFLTKDGWQNKTNQASTLLSGVGWDKSVLDFIVFVSILPLMTNDIWTMARNAWILKERFWIFRAQWLLLLCFQTEWVIFNSIGTGRCSSKSSPHCTLDSTQDHVVSGTSPMNLFCQVVFGSCRLVV